MSAIIEIFIQIRYDFLNDCSKLFIIDYIAFFIGSGKSGAEFLASWYSLLKLFIEECSNEPIPYF